MIHALMIIIEVILITAANAAGEGSSSGLSDKPGARALQRRNTDRHAQSGRTAQHDENVNPKMFALGIVARIASPRVTQEELTQLRNTPGLEKPEWIQWRKYLDERIMEKTMENYRLMSPADRAKVRAGAPQFVRLFDTVDKLPDGASIKFSFDPPPENTRRVQEKNPQRRAARKTFKIRKEKHVISKKDGIDSKLAKQPKAPNTLPSRKEAKKDGKLTKAPKTLSSRNDGLTRLHESSKKSVVKNVPECSNVNKPQMETKWKPNQDYCMRGNKCRHEKRGANGFKFGIWNRPHHCRKCGDVVCSKCSPQKRTFSNKQKERVCNECVAKYPKWTK